MYHSATKHLQQLKNKDIKEDNKTVYIQTPEQPIYLFRCVLQPQKLQ